MIYLTARRISAVLCVAIALSAVGVCTAPAQQQMTTQTFLANPGQLLQQYPNGGAGLIAQIRELAIADTTSMNTLNAILGLLANANKEQKTAIGSALAQAAKIVVRTNQAYATEIQQAIARTKDEDAMLAYSAAAGDQAIGAAGAGGGGSAGASGGQTNSLSGTPTGTGSAQPIGGGGTNTGSFSYTSVVSGGSTTTSPTTTTTSTIFNSVSP